jgi:hypothetical protein
MTNILYRFQTKVKKDSTNEKLVNFLKQKDTDLTEKERVWWAVSAFWLPLAMKEAGCYSDKEINQYALSAIQRLKQQIVYLSLVLDLELASSPLTFDNYPVESDTNITSSERNGENHQTWSGNIETENIEADYQEQENQEQRQKIASSSDNNQFDEIFGY